jgi:hypothetical protein
VTTATRCGLVLEGDLLFGKGKLKKVDAAFLEGFCEHYQRVGHGIFDKMYEQQPSKYFEALVVLAKAGLPLHVNYWRAICSLARAN